MCARFLSTALEELYFGNHCWHLGAMGDIFRVIVELVNILGIKVIHDVLAVCIVDEGCDERNPDNSTPHYAATPDLPLAAPKAVIKNYHYAISLSKNA